MSKTVIEQIQGELLRDGKTIYTVPLILTIKELWVDERAAPVSRALAKVELSPSKRVVVENGEYRLRYMFEGKQKEDSVRVEHNTLLAG